MQKTLYFDGTKAVPAWDVDSDKGWTILSGDGSLTTEQLYYLRVPWLHRAVEDRAQNVAGMPWAVFRGDAEYIASSDFNPTPNDPLYPFREMTRLLELYEMSMAMAGRAYLFLETNNSGYIKAVKYCSPASIEEVFDRATGEIVGYKRYVNGRTIEVPKSNIVAFYKTDYLTETGPGRSSAAGAALMAAGTLYNSEAYISQFFRRGAIKASIISYNGNPQEGERLQRWWSDVVSGIKNAWAALVVRGDKTAVTVIGEGLESLQNDSLTTAQRQEIATALGVPESRLWSSAANYATRKEDELAYYRGTILPEWNLFAMGLNTQVFTKEHKLDAFRIEPQPESLDIFQEDETERASALQQLTSAGLPLKLAMQLLGYDLTDEQWEMIDEQEAEPEPQMEPLAPLADEPMQPMEPAMEAEPDPVEVRAALNLYKRKALHALKLGNNPGGVEFVSSVIPSRTLEALRYELDGLTNPDDVKAAFEAVTDHDPEGLARALNRANEILTVFMEARA